MFETLCIFIPIGLLFAILPGPDFALMVKISLKEGKQAALGATCGIGVGVVLHTTAAVIGLSALITTTPFLFELLRYAGALYLLWMGLQLCIKNPPFRFFTKKRKNTLPRLVSITPDDKNMDNIPTPPTGSPVLRIGASYTKRKSRDWLIGFSQGAIINILNPKTVIFMVTLLPQFVTPHLSVPFQLGVLGGTMACIALSWFVCLALGMDYARRYLENPRCSLWLERCTALLLISFGVKLLITKLQ